MHTYAKQQLTAQKKDATSAASIYDSSSQVKALQRKAELANNIGDGTIQRMTINESLTDIPINSSIKTTKTKPGFIKGTIRTRNNEKIKAAFHHIYPKLNLVTPITQIEQLYQAIAFDKTHLTSKITVTPEEEISLTNLRNKCIKNNNSAQNFYWNQGSGFMGYPPELRADDPHEGIDKKPPRMDQKQYDLAKDDRPNALNTLTQEISNKTVNKDSIDLCHNNEVNLASYPLHVTNATDWEDADEGKYKLITSDTSPSPETSSQTF